MDLRDAIAQELRKFMQNSCYPTPMEQEVNIAVEAIIKASAASFTILPDCMMPDGGDPCQGFYQTCAKQADLETRLNRALHALQGPSLCGK